MKTTKKRIELRVLSVFVGILAISSSAYASGDVRFRQVKDESTAAVLYQGTQPAEFSLSIENSEETVVYYSDREKNVAEYKKLFDFSYLEDGTYTMIASFDGEKVAKEFVIKDSKLEFKEAKPVDAVATMPVIRESGEYLVCLFDTPADQSVSVMFNDDSQTFFEDRLETGEKLQKKYKISSLPRGEYEVRVFAGEDIHAYNFVKE